LYHTSVAQRLSSMRVQPEVEQRVRQYGRRRGWKGAWLTRGTVLGTVLEAGCRWPAFSRSLSLIATTPVPRTKLTEMASTVSIQEWLVSTVVATAAVLVSWFILPEYFRLSLVSRIFICLLVGLSSLTFPLLRRRRRRRRRRRYTSPSQHLLYERSSEHDVHYMSSLLPTVDTEIHWRDFMRIIRRQPLPESIPRWTRFRFKLSRRKPLFLVWSPSLRLAMLIFVMDALLPLEVGDRGAHSPAER
jgi:hypothetical protein